MRKLMFLALGAIVGLSFTACGNKQAQTGVYSDSTEVDSSKLKDVVVYGLCGDNTAMNSLQMMTDMGATLSTSILRRLGRTTRCLVTMPLATARLAC